MALDLPLWSVIETTATLYDRGQQKFHLLLTEPRIQTAESTSHEVATLPLIATPRLLWLELSPYRVVMTMQGNNQLSYRHFWENGVYGLNRYWLQEDLQNREQLRLRNYTRSLMLTGDPLPAHLRIEYELWSYQLQLGKYVLNLEIQHELD